MQAGDGEVFSRPGPRKTSLKDRLFPGRAENNLYMSIYGGWWKGCGRGSGMGLFPVRQQELFGWLLLPSENNPSELPAQTVTRKNPLYLPRSRGIIAMLLRRLIFVPQNEWIGPAIHSVASFSAKTRVLWTQNE